MLFQKRMDFINKDREKLSQLQAQHRIAFSGCQIFQTTKPFQKIRRSYGDIKVAFVIFHSTRLLAKQIYAEYSSLSKQPFYKHNRNLCMPQVPLTEWIDGMQDGWEMQVVMFAHQDFRKTLIVMDGVHFEEELREHYDRIWKVLDAFERIRTP